MNERSAQRVLEVHGLSVRIEAPRGGFAVVENVSLSIDRGEILVGQPLGWRKADRHVATGLTRKVPS